MSADQLTERIIPGHIEFIPDAEVGLKRRRLREVNRLREHFIICGAGRVGSRVIRELQRKGEPFVIIERASTCGSENTS